MPIVNIELKFNDQGAVTGARNLTALADAANKAQKSVSEVGEKGASSVAGLGKNAEQATAQIKGLATQILALVGAYKALQAASSFVSRTFDFSSNIEDSQIAIASVLGATNKISDSQGRMLEGAEKFNAAQQISAQMMEKIQVLALSTTATFDDIVQGVSGIIAPATKAGVAMEKLPQFAVTAAQAMTAMKIPVQQMRTEIEALLSGNINKSQDILATNLGITGEMVRNWQQQGTLVEELNKRLLIFAEAGEATAQTWTGLTSNMKDALDYLSSQTGKGLFEGAKQSYRELLALLVNTDQNKLGLNEDVKNLVEMMKRLEDEIGNNLVEVTRKFVSYIKELNNPENIADFEQKIRDVAGSAKTAFEALSKFGSLITEIGGTAMSAWQSLPEPVREWGLIIAILGGKKGIGMLTAGLFLAERFQNIGTGISAWADGKLSFSDFSSMGGADLEAWLKKNGYNTGLGSGSSGGQKAPQLARSGTPMSFVGPPKPDQTYTVTNAIGGFDNKKSGGADKIANAREQIQKLREEIDALNGEATKKSNSLDQKEREIEKLGKAAGLSAAEVAQLQDDYAEAFKTNTLKEFNKHLMEVEGNTKALRDIKIDEEMTKWQSSFNELVARGKMSSEEATESLTRMKTALVNQSEVKDLQTAVQFYKELGELSGQYGQGIEIQNRLLKEQARAWKQAGIPDELVAEMVKLKQLQDSVYGFDGAYRGLVRFTAEYSNEAKQWESITYSWATGFNDTTKDMWGDFLDTGKVSFDQLSLSFTKLLKDMSYQALVQPIVLSIVGMAQNSLYGMTTAGQSGGGPGGSSSLYGAAGSLAQQYGMSQLMNGAGVMTGITSTVNGWGASMFPSVFAPSGSNAAVNALVGDITGTAGTLPTSTLLGTLGAAGMGYGLGSLGGTMFAGIVGGNSANMGLGGGIGGGLGAGIGSILAPGLGTWIGGGLGTLLGSGVGSIFQSWNDEPGLWAAATIDLSKRYSGQQMEDVYRDRKHPWNWYTHADDTGYLIQSRHRDGMPQAAAQQATDYLAHAAQQGLALSDQISTALGGITGGLADAYKNSLELDSTLSIGRDWEGKTPDIEGLGSEIFSAMKGKISGALQRMDISSLSIAADGMLADTTDEMMLAITHAVQFVNVGESLGDYSGEFTQAVSGKVLDMLNSMDTSGMRLDIDKSSLAGWGVASQAVTAWNEIDAALESILRPTSELEAALGTAKTQFDGWLDSLKALGWQQEALAEIEKERLIYMQRYSDSLARGAEQDLYLRGMSLTRGSDSWAYQSQALRYQQENELRSAETKYGQYSTIYTSLLATQQAESTQAEISFLRKQYDSLLQEQISSAQSLVNSFDRVVDTLDEARRSLWSGDANISTSRLADARADFSTVYAKAMAGDADAMSQLPSISTNLLNLGKEQIASRSTYEDLFYEVDAKLKSAQGIAYDQYAAANSQVNLLKSQLSAQDQTNMTLSDINLRIATLGDVLSGQLSVIAGLTTTTTEAYKQNATNGGAAYSPGGVPSAEGVYGSKYKTEADLVAAKVSSLNITAYKGKTNWTAADFAAEVKTYDNATIEKWYRQQGVLEGFATGGITPANKPFWVGENGPELVVSPQQWGVINNADSMSLMRGMSGGGSINSGAIVAAINNMNDTLRQLLTKTDRIMADQGRIRDRMDMFAQEGVTIAAA